MKISLVASITSSAFNFRAELLHSLVKNGHQVTVYVSDYDAPTAKAKEAEFGIKVEGYPLARTGLNPFADIKACWHLCREFKYDQPDVVFSCQAKPVIWGGLAAFMARVPYNVGMLEGLGYTFTQQKDGGFTRKQKLLQRIQVLLYRLTVPKLDHMLFLNPDGPKDLLEAHNIKAQQVTVLGGIGVDLAAFPFSEPRNDKLRFIFIGRLLAEKGIREYVAAAKRIKQHHPEVEFVVLGGLDEGNPGGLKQHELDALIASGTVIHPGFVTDVKRWIAEASVFVLPSYREGVPRSTQEAMAIGRAVITTDVPGCRETVKEGVNGFLVPKWDVDALAQAMQRFMNEPELVVRMGHASHQSAQERYDVHQVNQRLIAMLGL